MLVRKVIHISDLHLSKEKKSLLQKDKFLKELIDSLKNKVGLDTMIISGDIVDCGGCEEIYEFAGKLVESFRKELEIENILCVPGNHDVNRDLLMGIKGDKNIESNNLWKYYDVKLKYYWNFIKDNNLEKCNETGLVSYKILENPNMILLGLDSTDHIGISDGYGYVNECELEKAFEELFLNAERKYNDFVKIAVMHHRPIIYESASQSVTENNSSEIGQYGTCDTENWNRVRAILLKYDVHYVFTGHVHGSQSGMIQPFDTKNDEMFFSTVGSIGVDFSNELKERLDLEKDKDLLEKLNDLSCYGSINGNHNSYNIWTFDDNGLIKEEQYKYLIDEGEGRWVCWKIKIFQESIEENMEEGIFDNEVEEVPVVKDEQIDYQEEILEYVRKYELYKSGHYHWKNSARLNWIDTSFFFQHKEKMFFIASGFNEIFEKEESLRKSDYMIGLGIKGCILLSYMRFLFPEKECSYFPENEKEYNTYEKSLFENDEKIDSIVVLTDIVHSGNTIASFASRLFEKVNRFLKVNVVTIFDATPDGKIADLKGKAKITLFSLAKIKVLDCPGGGESCDIYIRKLVNVVEYKED